MPLNHMYLSARPAGCTNPSFTHCLVPLVALKPVHIIMTENYNFRVALSLLRLNARGVVTNLKHYFSQVLFLYLKSMFHQNSK